MYAPEGYERITSVTGADGRRVSLTPGSHNRRFYHNSQGIVIAYVHVATRGVRNIGSRRSDGSTQIGNKGALVVMAMITFTHTSLFTLNTSETLKQVHESIQGQSSAKSLGFKQKLKGYRREIHGHYIHHADDWFANVSNSPTES